MLGTDWGAVWDWIMQPQVIVPVGIALVAAAYKVGTRRTDRRDRKAAMFQAAEDERLRNEAALDATHVDFGAFLCVPHGPGTGRPAQAAVEIEPWNTGVWVYGVRLSWRYRTDSTDAWRLADAPCMPYEPRVVLPASLPESKPLSFAWPGAPLPEPQAIEWELEIEWGVARTGGTRVTKVPTGSTSWQEVGPPDPRP